ncbi:MAG: hypothetical protein FD156_2010 [Nitrospirae bacterium]|nr:MAG: hypothetical protein FD156_2010 [Nitrospirota bacterium]
MTEESRSKHIAELAKELLDDIELNRMSAEHLLLKATRLARWMGSEETQQWLRLEMIGYNSTDEISVKYMSLTGRWINRAKGIGYWGPLAQQEAAIAAEKAKLAAMRTPDTGGEWANLAITNVTNAMTQTANLISTLSAIKSRVLARLHQFVSEVYYSLAFEGLSESIFERYKRDVDVLIAQSCGNVLDQIPAVIDRLAEAQPEAISQALTTCRRIIESFADSIFPPTEETIEIGGSTLNLGLDKHQNRINAYIHQHTDSQTRKKRLRQNLVNLFDRVSTGVHTDVTLEEARALFLNTYLLLGEILHIGRNSV